MAVEISPDNGSSNIISDQVLLPHDTNDDADTHNPLRQQWVENLHRFAAGAGKVLDQSVAHPVQTPEAAISALNRAVADSKKDGATPQVRGEFEAAIKSAETIEATFDKTKLQTEIDNAQTEINGLNLEDRTAEIIKSIDNLEKTLPQDQKQQLAAIDAEANVISRQHDTLANAIQGRQPTQAEQKILLEYEAKLDKLGDKRDGVYQLPGDIAEKRDALNDDQDRADTLNKTILKDKTQLHFASIFRASYAEVLEQSGDTPAADKEREKIAVTDTSFFAASQHSDDGATPVQTPDAAISALNRAVADSKKDGITPLVREEFEAAIKAAETIEAGFDKTKIQAEIANAQSEIKTLNLDDRAADIIKSIDSVEKNLPQGQQQQLATIDKEAADVIRQREALAAKIKGREPTPAEQKDLLGYEAKLDQLTVQRDGVYQLPGDIAEKQNALQRDYGRATELNQMILNGETALHFASRFRDNYAESLEQSGDKPAADKQREAIKATDPSFDRSIFDKRSQGSGDGTQSGSVDLSTPGPGTQEAVGLLKQVIQDLNAGGNKFTPEMRALLEQAKQKADTQFDSDKAKLEAKIEDAAKRLKASNDVLAPYDNKLAEWLKQNPEAGTKWETLNEQQQADLLPSDIQQLGAQLLQERRNRADINSELIGHAVRLGEEAEATIWVRAYEAAALKQSGDPGQIKQSQQLLKEALHNGGGTPQAITQMALDILQQTNDMNAAKPIFQAAIDAADLAKAERQEQAAVDLFAPGMISTPEAAAAAADIVAHPDSYAAPKTESERLLATALALSPMDTRREYAVALFKFGSRQEAIDLLEKLRSDNPSDPFTVAALQVAQDPTTTEITDAEVNKRIEAIADRNPISLYTGAAVDMAVTGIAMSRGLPAPLAMVAGSAISTPVYAVTEYLINGRIPSKAEIGLIAATALGGAAIQTKLAPAVTSGVLRVLGTRTANRVQSILETVAPDAAAALSGLRGSERILATKAAADAVYSGLRTSGLGATSPQTFSQLWRSRLILGAAYKTGAATGIGVGILASDAAISGVYQGIGELSAPQRDQLIVPPNDVK